jgi:hypothetical protein
MSVADHSGNWTPVRPADLRARVAAHASAQGANARAYVIYWATARQPNSVESTIRNGGITSIQFLPYTAPH